MEIWATQSGVFVEALAQAGITNEQVAAIGITNQRETAIVWDKITGRPIYNAIVWQSRQSTPICDQLKRDGMEEHIRKTTGLVIDPYFSGTKISGFSTTSKVAANAPAAANCCSAPSTAG